ncbi:MAG: hypothetical protein SOV50_08090 [Lentihominibacter sp.]|nr:hypothetical protein [Clostridiales bacterium]MDD6648255.1 hypothetical protein [Bacillota bacterium]MDY2680591.1 hypothetical protein [Lentihominibacter sp.]
MILIILALLFGIVVLAFLIRSNVRKKPVRDSIIYKILKILILAEAAVFVVLFVIVLIKTIMS